MLVTPQVKHEKNDQSYLVDRFGRRFNYARVALTERCNLRCTYCMPEEGVDFCSSDQLLSQEEVIRLIGLLASMGVDKLRFTGGEPTLRKDLPELVSAAKATLGIKTVYITTNGLLLHRSIDELYQAGLDGINFSLDTLQPQRFEQITRRQGLTQTLENIDLAVTRGISSIKINIVVMRGINDDEIKDFCELTREYDVTVRFIEFMPFDARQLWVDGDYLLRAKEIVAQLHHDYSGLRAFPGSKTEHHCYRVEGYRGRIAVIPAFTRSLCRSCNRLRITADGQLRNCLYSETDYDLRSLLRMNVSDEQIAERIRHAVKDKAIDGVEARERSTVKVAVPRISMTQIGG